MIVGIETPWGAEVLALFAAADARSASLYPAASRHGSSAAALVAAEVRFFVAREDGRAVGCGGYVRLGAAAAEMKRLFVAPAARGKGVGQSLVRAIAAAAAGEGVEELLLETGIESAEALRLYRRLGFQACAPFGDYRLDALSVFMGKRLS